MKINILKQIDLSLIDKAIAEYEAFYMGTPYWTDLGYLIMSAKTRDAIEYECNQMGVKYVPNNDANAVEYHGLRIAIDNGLEFGKIEIR